ncbi:MAG: hypothetical protein ACYCUX_05880 [Metallibacterium sp.]
MMTFDEYNKAISGVFTELQKIADRTAGQALFGKADTSNPEFVALMQRHAQLTKLASELTERMTQQMQQ